MKRRGTQILTGGLAAVVASGMAAFGAPGAYAAGTVSGDVDITNTETVQVLMGADGKIDAQRVYEQLVLKGSGKVDIANPVSAKGLRNLDGFGGFDERDGQMRINTTVDGTKKYRSVSDFTEKLPLKISIDYELDGKKIKPQDVVGKSGTLTVKYTVTNVTGQQQDVSYQDGDGKEQASSENVVIPMVGSLTTVLPSNFTEVKSAEANAAGDGRGGTQLSFTMTLIPPIGSDTATFGYTAKVKDARIPKANLSALPVNPLESPSFKGGAASYQSGAETGQELTAGATEIDSNVLKLRDGASDLVAGLVQLRDGAGQLNAGLTNDAAPGARKLSDGLKKAAAGGPQLLDGVSQLTAGAQKVDGGLQLLVGQVNSGVADFKDQFAGSADGAMAQVSGGIGQIINGYLDGALTATANSLDDPAKSTLLAQIAATKQQLQGVQGMLTGPVASGLKSGVNGGLDQLAAKIAAGVGAPASKDTLRNGVAQLVGGLNQLKGKGGELASGLEQLSSGANKLSNGLGDAASGSGQLADGLNQATEKAPALPEGADRLSEEGMSQLIAAGDETAKDYGLKYALIEAGAVRAGDAQPYGSPEGAVALTAYKFEIAGADDTGSKNVTRGIAAIVLLAAAAGVAAVRRRVA